MPTLLSVLCSAFRCDDNLREEFILTHYEDVYTKYADLYPEEINSDWYLEDAIEEHLYNVCARVYLDLSIANLNK